jgi:hypothetical protein
VSDTVPRRSRSAESSTRLSGGWRNLIEQALLTEHLYSNRIRAARAGNFFKVYIYITYLFLHHTSLHAYQIPSNSLPSEAIFRLFCPSICRTYLTGGGTHLIKKFLNSYNSKKISQSNLKHQPKTQSICPVDPCTCKINLNTIYIFNLIQVSSSCRQSGTYLRSRIVNRQYTGFDSYLLSSFLSVLLKTPSIAKIV